MRIAIPLPGRPPRRRLSRREESLSAGRPEGLAILGLRLDPRLTGRTTYQVLAQERPCPDRYARRVGIPAKRPLF